MLTVTCDFCGQTIKVQGKPDEYRRFLKIYDHKYKDKDVQIRIEVKVKKPVHICAGCGRKAVKSLLK